MDQKYDYLRQYNCPQPSAYARTEMRALEEEQAAPDPKAKPKALNIVFDILFWFFCIALVASSVLFALNKDPRKSYFGYRIYSVKTESMTPRADGTSLPGGFSVGAMVVVKICEPEEIKEGDIITFNPNTRDETGQTYLTHRVVEVLDKLGGKEGIYFITRGDANNDNDTPIPGKMLIGKKVLAIPATGRAFQWVKDNFILSMVILVSVFVSIFLFRMCFKKSDEKEQEEKDEKENP